MKKFRIIDMNIFKIWAISVPSYLEGRICVWNTESLYPEHCLASRTASNEKTFYTNCLRLIETIDSDIKIISIRSNMQKVEPPEGGPLTIQKWGAPSNIHITDVSRVARLIFCFVRAIQPWKLPRIEKHSMRKLFASSKRLNFLLMWFWSEVVYFPKIDPQGAASC